MTESTIEIQWHRDQRGFEITESPIFVDGEPFLKGKRTIRKGGELIDTEPLKNDRLFVAFACIREAHELLKFVETHGPLTLGGLRYDNDDVQIRLFEFGGTDGSADEDSMLPVIHHMGDSVDEMLREAAWFRRAIECHRTGDPSLATILNEVLQDIFVGVGAVSVGKNIQLKVRPASLLDALKLQLVQSLAGIKWNTCAECGTLYALGRRGDGSSYSNSKFCGCKCRKAAFRKRNKKS